MTFQSLGIFINFTFDQIRFFYKLTIKILPSIITATLLWVILGQEIIYSVITGVVVIQLYNQILFKLLQSLPKSFTYGEGAIVSQGLVIFLYNCFLQLPNMSNATELHQQLISILQLGLLGVMLLVLSVYYIPFLKNWQLFYLQLLVICTSLCLTVIDNHYAITILWNFVFKDLERSIIVGLYILFLALAATAVVWQIQKNQKSSSAIRKIFHILIVLVYVPGMIYQCNFLFIASVVILALLIVLELSRVIMLYPVYDVLESSVSAFIDEKDAGKVAFTPLYLLAGCSLPLWIHNSPCDLIDSCSFEFLPLLSGILSIGIGDTFASVIGSKIGRHKWSGKSQKSVEGTIASILGQCAFIYCLNYFGFLYLNTRLMAISGIAVISNALIEAFTDQVDNLILPIITYAILAIK